jgi:hypothetical protein
MPSLYDYRKSIEIAAKDYPFYALLFALIRQADTDNLECIRAMWPEAYDEFQERYNAPGGVIDADKSKHV